MPGQEEFQIESFEELHEIFEKSLFFSQGIGDNLHHWEVPLIYRGMSDVRWLLTPSVGRINGYAQLIEQQMLTLFKTGARPYLRKEPANEWEWVSLAQHHGLPTRILDWTKNPLVATYFAIEDDTEADGVIYVLPAPKVINIQKFDPFTYDRDEIVFNPEHVTQRIVAQQGQFTIHKNPQIPFTGWLRKIIIPTRFRKQFRLVLSRYGISRDTLFPGLDGLARHIKWVKTEDRLELLGIQPE